MTKEKQKKLKQREKKLQKITNIRKNNMKKYEVFYTRLEPMTLRKYFDLFYFLIDCNPLHQRPPVESKVGCDKSVAIIKSILNGINIGEITLVVTPDGEYEYESIDGGHRKRAIYQFMNDEFKVNGLYYSELSSEEKEDFDNYELSFIVYDSLSNFLKGYIFRSVNETTDVNNQETLNSFGNSKIACIVRETVRPISANGKITMPHELFDFTSTGLNYKYIADTNNRLNLEEFVSRILYRIYKDGKIGSRTYEELTEMFLDEEVNTVELKKELDTLLDFLTTMAKARYNLPNSQHQSLSKGEMNVLANFWFYMNEKYPNWYLEDPMKFYKKFREVWVGYWTDKKLPDANRKYAEIFKADYESNEVSIAEVFKSYTTDYQHEQKQRKCIEFLLDEIKITEFFIVKNRQRDFDPMLKERKLSEQGDVCAMDGKPLEWKDAHAAHIKAWSRGGETEWDNLAMVRKEYNWDMKTMHLEEYKERYFNVA